MLMSHQMSKFRRPRVPIPVCKIFFVYYIFCMSSASRNAKGGEYVLPLRSFQTVKKHLWRDSRRRPIILSSKKLLKQPWKLDVERKVDITFTDRSVWVCLVAISARAAGVGRVILFAARSSSTLNQTHVVDILKSSTFRLLKWWNQEIEPWKHFQKKHIFWKKRPKRWFEKSFTDLQYPYQVCMFWTITFTCKTYLRTKALFSSPIRQQSFFKEPLVSTAEFQNHPGCIAPDPRIEDLMCSAAGNDHRCNKEPQ